MNENPEINPEDDAIKKAEQATEDAKQAFFTLVRTERLDLAKALARAKKAKVDMSGEYKFNIPALIREAGDADTTIGDIAAVFPDSTLRGEAIDELRQKGIIVVSTKGSKKILTLAPPKKEEPPAEETPAPRRSR